MSVSLRLLGRFSILVDDEGVEVAPTGQRVLALLALRGGAAHRAQIAGTLWPERTDQRALANLRSAIWRLPDALASCISTKGLTLATEGDWDCDVDRVVGLADQPQQSLASEDRRLLSEDLLPQWDEPWLVVRRERYRQRRLHLIEDVAAAELEIDHPLDAVDTALIAIADEPLRESAQILLMRAHLQAGNRLEALQQYDRFEQMLRAELDVSPSDAMVAMANSVRNDDSVGDVAVTSTGKTF